MRRLTFTTPRAMMQFVALVQAALSGNPNSPASSFLALPMEVDPSSAIPRGRGQSGALRNKRKSPHHHARKAKLRAKRREK